MSAEPPTLFDPSTELGRAYAAVDWSATPLGPVSAWPVSLRTTVRTMINSRFAMWMGWGPDLIFFCNDAYRRDTLGSKFPWALGRPAGQVWAEIWDDVRPRVDSVMRDGEATWDEALMLFLERSGYAEETYHTFSYSPLAEDDGRIAGMLCVVSEDTGRVISERRITTLRDLGSELAKTRTEADVSTAAARCLAGERKDLPFVLAYVIDADGTRAHRAWSTGFAQDDPAAPAHLDLADPTAAWVAQDPIDGGSHRVSLGDRFADLPTGAWAEPPLDALTLPLRQSGQSLPYGFLVVGLNRHRPVDADYLGFLDLLADQIAAAIARARAFAAERTRAEQMAELNLAKTTFFTNVSHELRTPLTLLLGPAEDALADVELAPRQRGRVEVIHRNAERLLKLVNTLLDFSRLESGRAQAAFETTDLAALTRQLTSMFESAFARAGLSLDITVQPLAGTYHVDREMWAKIVLNLVSNALKATFEGGVTVELDEPDSGRARLTVTDTGIGIPAAEQERLFERFHRVSGARLRSHEGSGIGLALVAELTALHAGTVSVTSAVGAGTTFTVEIASGSEHLPADQLVTRTVGAAAPAAALGAGYVAEALRWVDGAEADGTAATDAAADHDDRPDVLVVDDNADMRHYVAGLLVDRYRVRVAQDGEQALAAARAQPPDLVLTDVMMPRLDGFGLLAALRADPRTMHVPVIMLSARSGDEAAVEGLESGADDYLVKPFSARELLARVRANLELDRVRRLVAELERNRGLLAHAEEQARVGSYEYDIARDSFVGSAQYYRLTGVSPEDVTEGGLGTVLRLVHPDDLPHVREQSERTVTDGVPFDVEFRLDESAGGRVLWVTGAVERDAAGRPATIRGSVQDVTDRRRAEVASAAATASQEAEAREHAIAAELQRSLLPASTFDADQLEVAAYYRAGVEGTEVGGDWYDVIDLDAGRTALVLGDVMGRGVRAAAVMGQLRATVRAYARLDVAPDYLLHLLDAAVREISPNTIVTCVYAIYDPSDRTFTYANAGHLPPLLTAAGGGTRRLTAGGPPLGTGRTWAAPESVTLAPGTLVTLYTDGLVEKRDSDLDEEIDALVHWLDTASGPLDTLPDRLVPALRPQAPDDDIAVLVARVPDTSADEFAAAQTYADEPEVPRLAREFATEHLVAWQVGEHLLFDVQLVVSELVTNALRHGRTPVTLRMRHAVDRLYIDVHDAAAAPPQMRHPGPADDGGRGLLIVATIAERWGTRHTDAGKSVWCLIRLT